MAVIVGSTGGWTLFEGGYSVDKSGLGTLTLTFRNDDFGQKFTSFRYGKNPPLSGYAHLCQDSYQVTFKDGKSYCALTCMGVDPDGEEMVEQSIDICASTEPIETHPDFLEKIVTGKTPENKPVAGVNKWFFKETGALFDAVTGDFEHFTTLSGDIPTDAAGWAALTKARLNKFAGLRNYYCPSVTATEKKALRKISGANFNAVGKVSSPPFSWLPEVSEGRSWLQMGFKITPICAGKGGLVQERNWQLSGPRGWLTPFPYGSATSGGSGGLSGGGLNPTPGL